MKLTVFQADKGDCLLLTGSDGTRMLVDGGMRNSYRDHVAPALGRLEADGKALDLVYVSHIDQDHIAGVLQLMDDIVAWKVRDFQHDQGNDTFRDPPRPRPPEVRGLWHNAFEAQVRLNAGPIEEALAASAAFLEPDPDSVDVAESQRVLATSVAEGIELSRRVKPDQLGIPLNEHFDGKLAMVRDPAETIPLGSLRLTVIGPFQSNLDALRKKWNKWLEEHKDQLARLLAEMREDVDRLSTGQVRGFEAGLEQRAKKMGRRSQVTEENLASLMLLAEENGKTVLLTGDGHVDEIVAGLRHAGRLDDAGLHVDVLKVQHHGSEHNITAEFCKLITADTYLFCGNGEHENPDLEAIRLVVSSRVGRAGDRRKFTLSFNSSSRSSTDRRGRAHMKKVEQLVASLAADSGGRMRFAFLDGSSFELAP